jgi:hypothetical protein
MHWTVNCVKHFISPCLQNLYFLNCVLISFLVGWGVLQHGRPCLGAHLCAVHTSLLLPTKTDSVGLTRYLVHQMLVVPTTVFLSCQCWLYAWCMLQIFWIIKTTHNGDALYLFHNVQFKKQCLKSFTNLLAEMPIRQAYKCKSLIILVLCFLH